MRNPKLKSDVLAEVQAIFEECTGVTWSDVKPGDDLREDVGMDDMDLENLSVEIDDRFGVELPEEWYSSVRTMGELVEYLEQHLAV